MAQAQVQINFGVVEINLKTRPLTDDEPYPEGSYELLKMVKPNCSVRVRNVGKSTIYLANELDHRAEYPIEVGDEFALDVPNGRSVGYLYLVGPPNGQFAGRAKVFFMDLS